MPPDSTLPLLIGFLTAVPFVLGYWVARFLARRRLGAALRLPRPWQLTTLQDWVKRSWLPAEAVESLPQEISPAVAFYEWARVDAEAAREWRFREPVTIQTPLEALVRDVWSAMPEAARTRSRERLAEAVVTAQAWWGGAEQGWTGRPLSLLASDLPRKKAPLPLLGIEDLTAAPLPGILAANALRQEADGPDLVLALVALRRAPGRFMHPLAPKADAMGSLVQGLSTRVGSDVGRRIGAGLGAALGPIGVMVGQYVGGMVGTMGGKALADQALPSALAEELKRTEAALAALGEVAQKGDLAEAARQPADAILELGKAVEVIREARSRRLRERFWPTPGLAVVEEVLRAALSELSAYRAAADHFVATARSAPAAVAGGMVLQNPWLVRRLPGGVERLNEARAALNRAAIAVRRVGNPSPDRGCP